MAVKAGGEEVLHTVMEIRANPYEDLEEVGIENIKDKTVELGDSPFEDNLVGKDLAKKAPQPLRSVPALGHSASNDNLNLQGNMKMNLGLHNKAVGNARSKKNIAKMGIPAIDLSTLKNVKDFKDWYGYSQKLENAIRLLREKTEALEKDGDMKELQIMKLEKQIELLQGQVCKYAEQNKALNQKYQDAIN